MKPIYKNVLAVIIGIISASIVNMGLITIGPLIIPPPPGVDNTDMESLAASMHLFELKDFIFPFLAHGIGTLAGAFAASFIAASQKMKFALVVGVFYLIMGIYVNFFMLPSPFWFTIVDLAGAYLPMAWLGFKLYEKFGSQ